MLVMMAGLPGTGKSTLARALAEGSGGVVLDKDVIRAALFAPARVEYSREQDDFCQEIMLRAAQYLLAREPGLRIFLDGRPFSRRYQRQQVYGAAAGLPTTVAVIECVCREETALARLQRDCQAAAHPAANRDAKLYSRVRAEFEFWDEPRLTIDTDRPLAECVQKAEQYLDAVPPPRACK